MTRTKYLQLLLIVAVSCHLACATVSKPVFSAIVKQRPEKRLASYPFDPKSSLVSRVRAAPDFLIAYLRTIDKKDTYTPYQPTAEETAMLGTYLEKLPPLHKRVLQERLVGIFFVNDFWGSGMADYVLGENDEIHTIMIINPETMRHDMSAWMTYRENSIFKTGDDSIRVAVDCGTEYTGLMYALLHETTHIVDYVKNYTPYTDNDMKLLGKARQETEFAKHLWEDIKRPVQNYESPKRKDITLYGFRNGPLLTLKEALPLYEKLAQTPFPSLLSWTGWPEDFAEYVTWHHFTEKLNQPYTIMVYEHNKRIFTYAPFSSELVERRLYTIQDIFINSNNPGE